jgi:hypothetical protein
MKLLGIALAVVVACVVLFKLKYPTYAYRYRMTVNVVVDGQVHSGSSVIEARVSKQPVFLGTVNPIEHSVLGEAVFVDIVGGPSVVALLTSGVAGQNADFPSRIVPSHFKLDLLKDTALVRLPDLRGSWDLSSAEFPTFVVFDRPGDPSSSQIVRPDETFQISGRSVRIAGVRIEMTTDQITHSIESKLGWWKNSGRPALIALQAAGLKTGASIDAEFAFRRN